MNPAQMSPETLEALQRDTFGYFMHEANQANGLILDKTKAGAGEHRGGRTGVVRLPHWGRTFVHHT